MNEPVFYPPDLRLHETDIETIEMVTRYKYYLPMDPKLVEACNKEFLSSFRPNHVILTKTEYLYKALIKPLASLPSHDKKVMGDEVKKTILNIRTHISRSASLHSVALSEAKEASLNLQALRSHIDLMCGIGYIRTNFHSKLCYQIADIHIALDCWFKVLKNL